MKQLTRKKINKIDYFVGVFVSAILNCASNKPALIDESNDSKRVVFDTNQSKFNIYVKYSTSRKGTRDKYWNIPFTENDYEKLSDFKKIGYNNYIVAVCADSSLKTTWIAVLNHEKIMSFLGKTTSPGSGTIKVLRKGYEQKFSYGVAGSDESEYETCYFDFTRYFDRVTSSS